MYRRRRSSGGGSVLDYDPLEEERRRESVSQGAEGDAPDPYAKRIHEVKDEREDVQKKTFAKWINSQLAKGQHPPVTDLFYDLRDGTRLLALLEVLTNKTYKREKGRMRVHHLNNVSRALSILEEHSVKLINISNEHIVDGSAKLTLGLVWAIILHWQVQGVLKDVMSDLQQTNLEKTLLAWCRQTTKGYHGVDVRNFTTSWTDGLAFNALIHSHRPQLFDWTVMARKHPYARLENAFRLANEHFNIERLLDPEDVNSQVPDKKSIMMYVMCLFQALPHGSFTMESLDVSIQSDSSFSLDTSSENVAQAASKGRPLSNVSIGLGEYQRTLEEVLTWLLGAEDRLAVMPPIANTTEEVKDQFHDLEELMLELTSKQGGIGDVLGEGSRLLKEGVMEEEEEEEVRVQMKLLNTRWEELRVKAMDRQSRLHEKLMSLQQAQLESLKKWLTETEDRIANMSQVGPTTDVLKEQIAAHQSLQEDLESEQANINSLSNMVVVVDESSSDSAYSSLEDELNALGERWAHICRWAESRWKTLQTLSVHWIHYEQEMNKMGEWMNEKESLLREVESNPSSDQEHILRQASMLQILQAEMEVQHRRFEHLQEESAKVLSHLPQDSPGQEKIPAELEMVQDRLDCLVSIIEAQTQRMAANGIDIKKVVIPGDNTSDIVSSSTTTISHEDATVVTKIITTKVITTEMVEGSVIKRQKLEGGSQEDFSVALHQLGGWMDSLEAEVRPKVAGELTIEQLLQLAQQLENEIEGQKEEYYKVVSLGQSAISETSTIGESAKESEQQVAGITSRWEALNAMLIEIRTRITFLTEKKKVTTQLSDLEVQYEGFLRWFEDVRTVSENEPNAVTLQMEQCQSKITAMDSHEAEIGALKTACEALDGNFAQETQPVMEQVQTFVTKWEALKMRLMEWSVTLKERVGQVTPTPMVVETVQTAPPESLVKAMEASRKWLESLETALASEHVVSSLPQMQDMLLKFQDLSQKVEMEQGNMNHINDACNALIKDGQIGISDDFTKLSKQWETTTEALQSRIKAIEKVIEKQKQYNDEVSGLCSWMSEVDVFLQAEEPALGDIETLEAQLEQSNALQDDIVTLENNVTNITTSGKQLMEEAESEVKGAITVQLDELTKRWALVTELAKAQNKSLKDALAKSQKVHEDIQVLNTWLDEMDQKVPTFGPIETSSELSSAIDMFTKLREEISEHSEEFRGVNNTGNEMLQHDAVATHEELARQFTQLNGRWTDVVTQVDSRYKVLSTASEQYEDFKKLCSEETEWLNQLQEKLEKSSKSAADAEEISEALDDLEIFLHSHNESRLEQIRNLAEALVQENCMSVAVQNATHTLTSRFDTLNAQASEHQSGLEGRVQEAQAWEREYVSVLDYLVQSDMVLTQAITDSQLRIDPVQVQEELVKQQEVLKKMQAQVDVYRTQGKTEAALRLEDQVTHLLKKYEEVEMKLRLCQKPSDFDDRLQQMNQELNDISQRVHLVTVTSGDPEGIQEQLNQCMALYQRLSEVKAEVESVIATGRKIVKEGQALDPESLTLQLDQLKGLYNQLGGTVTEHRGMLEKALRHSRKIQKDSSHLEEWLSTTECELDQREATIPTRNVEGEVHFAQHAIDDLGRKRPLLTGLHESYAALASMCDDDALLQPIKEQVDDIALTWERVNTRLANRLKNMQSEQVNKEAEMEKFIVGLGEIKGWLQSTEYQLTNLSKVNADEQARIIKSISTEVQNYKGHIENIRDTAVDLINHGALFQARVQPELIEINQRWENIFKNVQQCSQDIQGTSLTSVTLTAETQGSRPSPSQTNTSTTTNLSTITTSVVHETSVTTSLTSTTTQLIHTKGTSQVSDELMMHVHQQDGASAPVQPSWAADTSSNNEEQEKGASLRSIGLVKSVMSTSTTLTSPIIDDSEIMEAVTESEKVHSVEEKPLGEISECHREIDENDMPVPGLKTVDVSDSVEMFSSADSARWGESSLVDSVIKVEPRENKAADEDHTLTLVTNTVTKKVDRSSSEMEGIDTETVKYVLEEQPSDDTEQKKKMSLVEVEEVKMTISHLSFNIPGTSSEKKVDKLEADILACGSSEESPIDSSLEVSPTAEFPPNSLLSSDLSSQDSPGKDRKRKITENEDDLDNFDELIAGLKEVAEKDINLSAIEKNRRRSSEKDLDQDLSGDERFSLLKIRRRDDDDLESLASVDTDMAPASETSRDFEGTFSDLESVTESVSSKGDNLFAPMGAHGLTILDTSRNEEVSTVEFISQQSQIASSEAVTHAYISSSQQLVSPGSKESLSDIISAKISSISSGVTSDSKQSMTEKEISEKDIDAEEESHAQKDYEQLPVEKLQAMIAELEEVMSDAELSDTEDEDPQGRNKLPTEKMDVSESIQTSKTDELPNKDVDMKVDSTTEAIEETSAPDRAKTNIKFSSTERDTLVRDLLVAVKEPSLTKDEAKCEADPIEFRVQEVHVGDVEFAQAKGLFEKDPVSLETPASVVKITTPLHDDVSNESSFVTSLTEARKTDDDKDKLVQKVSVQSSQVVHGITFVTSTEDRLPEAEEAVLVTLISRPSSAEVMTTVNEVTEGKAMMELVEEEGSETDVVDPDMEVSQKDISCVQGPDKSSSSSSDEDDSNKKERRPTVIECPSFLVALQEGDAENDKKVNPACEVDNSSLGSVAMSTGQHSVSSTIPTFVPSEGVSDQFSVLSQKNVSGDGGLQTIDVTPITLTHLSSGISSSMMDFFSRHNVLILDTDAKGQDGTVTVEPMEEEDEGKIEETKSLSVSISETPVRSPSPIQTLSSEIMQDPDNTSETVQIISSSVTSSSTSTATIRGIQNFTSPAELWSNFTRDMPSTMHVHSMQFQFPVAGNNSKVGRNIPIIIDDEQASSETMSEGNIESLPETQVPQSQPVPVDISETTRNIPATTDASSEMQHPTVSKPQVVRNIPIMLVDEEQIDMDVVTEKTPDLPHEGQSIAVCSDMVSEAVGNEVLENISRASKPGTDATSLIECHVKGDITTTTQNITEKLNNEEENGTATLLLDSSHSSTSEIQTQMIEASDVESGSVIEVIYQVEGSKDRRKAVVTPPDEADIAELLQDAPQSDGSLEGSQMICNEGASSRKVSVASQNMVLAEQEVVENITTQTAPPEACLSFQELSTGVDDMVTPLSTEIVCTEGAVPHSGLRVEDVGRKISVGSMEVSVSLGEVAGDLKIPDQPPQSFAHERQTSLSVHENFGECVVTKSDDIFLMDVESLDGRDTGRKISTASMEVNIESGEIAGTLETCSGPIQSFAVERQTSLKADNIKDFIAVRSEVVQVAGPLSSSEELIIPDIQSGLLIVDSNRASPREENVEKLPIGFIDTEMMESEMGKSQSSDAFSFEDQLPNPNAENVASEATEIVPGASKPHKTEKKISTATEEFTFAEQEVVSAISTPLLQTQSFTYPQDISLTVKDNLAEGAVLSSVIQMKNSAPGAPEEDKQEVERKLSTATKEVEVIPYEIPEVVGTTGVEARAFALERSASETGREILKEAILVSPETVLQGTPQDNESCNASTSSSASYLVADTFAQRKISVASDVEVLEVIERPHQCEPLIEQSLSEEKEMTSTEGLESVDMADQIYKTANTQVDECGRKISTASMEIEESYSELLCEKQMYLPERYTCTVEVAELDSCKDDVITTSVKAVVSVSDSNREDPSTKVESSRDSVVISEVSEEGIPLGCEAALMNPNLVTGFEIKSLSGEGTDFEDISVDEIAFITGVKSAMPAGYTFRANTAEDDTMSEALSYYDLDNSFAVKDRYGVAVTVSGTLEGTEALVDEGGEEKQIPLEEGGLEELVMEPSFNALLKSSRHSSRGASLDNLFDSAAHEEGPGIEKICNKEPEVASANRSTFLTEVETSPDKHFSDVSKVEKYQYSSTTSKNSSHETSSIKSIKIATDIGDKKKSSETIESDSAFPGEILSPGETELPFVSTKQVRKPDTKLDRLDTISASAPVKKEKSKEAKAIKKVKMAPTDESPKMESKLKYTPFVPPGIKYGQTAKNMDDNVSKPEVAEKVMEQEMVVKECYSPHHQPSERSEDKSINLVDIPVCPEGLKVREEITEDKSSTKTTAKSELPGKEAKVKSVVTTEHEIKVTEQTNIQTLIINISNGENHKTITHTSEVKSDCSTFSEKEKDSIPETPKAKDSEMMKASVPEEENAATVKESYRKEGDKLKPKEPVSLASQKKTDIKIQYIPHVPIETENKTSEAEKSAVTDSKPKIHYVPHAPSDLLKESCETKETSTERSAVLTEAKITTKPTEAKVKKDKDVKLHYVPYAPSDILKSIPEEEKCSKEVPLRASKGESPPQQTSLQQQKKAAKIEKEGRTDAPKKIQYVPHVPIKFEVASSLPSVKPQAKKTTQSIIIREEELSTVKETAITSDDEDVGQVEPSKPPTAKSEKTQPIKINYVPCVTNESQINDLAADRKTKSVVEAQVHVPAEKPQTSATVSSKETTKSKEKSEIQYVPYATSDLPKVSSGARPKEIHYVPHSPSDLERFKMQEPVSKAPVIPSVIITSPSSCKLDSVVTSSSSIPESIVKSEDIEDTVSIHSQNEEDEISSVEAEHQLMETDTSEKFEDECRADIEPIMSVRETGDTSDSEKDIVIKKRKRFAKLYEEVDNDIKEMTSEAKVTKTEDRASSTSYLVSKEEKVTPEELEKVMRKRGLLTKKALYENWESISSCSSGAESKRGSSTEGSIDFGSETRGAVSGDWDDAPIPTDLNLQNSSAESKSVPVESIPEEATCNPSREELRFSFVSSSSIEIDRDEVFTSEMEMDFQDVDALAEVAEIDSPSSDESDDLEEPSKVRISAATIYEDAVIQALEGGSERGTGKRKHVNVDSHIEKAAALKDEPQTSEDNRASVSSFYEQLPTEISVSKTNVIESTASFEEKEKETSIAFTKNVHQPEGSPKIQLTMNEPPKIRNKEDLASEVKPDDGKGVHAKQPKEGEVLEIIYEVVTVTRTKEPRAQTVIERVIIEPEETVSETESDIEENLKDRVEHKKYVGVNEKDFEPSNEYIGNAAVAPLLLTNKNPLKDSETETDRDVMNADVKAKTEFSPSLSQKFTREHESKVSQDGEKPLVHVVQTATNITHTLQPVNEDVLDISKPVCEGSHEISQSHGDKIAPEKSLEKVIPQYTSSVQNEKETFEIAVESHMTPSIVVNLVSVEVREVFDKADISETSTNESKQYRVQSPKRDDYEGSPECSIKCGTVMDEASKVLLEMSQPSSSEQYAKKDPETMEDFSGIEGTTDKVVSHSFMTTHKIESISQDDCTNDKQKADNVVIGRNEVFISPIVEDVSGTLAAVETFEDCIHSSSYRPSESDSDDSLKEFGKEDTIQTLDTMTRRHSATSSSSSNSSFEMVECEPEVDLEEQLSSHESYEEAEIEDKEDLVESDESLDKMAECTAIGEAVHPEITSVSLEIKLERHVSIDSSVSTLSEAETVIHVPIGSLPKKISETASVKDDSQIGVKSGEAKDPLVRSVSEELITKTGNQGGIKQIGKSPTVLEAVESGKEDLKKDEDKEEEQAVATCIGVKPIHQKVPGDNTAYQKAEVVTTGIQINEDIKNHTVEIISSVPIKHEYYPIESCTINTLPVNESKCDLKENSSSTEGTLSEGSVLKNIDDSMVLMNPGFLMVEPSYIVEEEKAENTDMEKSAYVNIIKDKKKEDPDYTFSSEEEEKSDLNVSRTSDTVQEIPLVHEEGWTEIKILNVEEKDQVNLERRVSVDVAQVIQTTEVSEEQEVTISIPDIHSEDLRDDSSVQSDEEQASKVSKLKEENQEHITRQSSEEGHFIVLQHHVENRKLPSDSSAKTEVSLCVSQYTADANINDSIDEDKKSTSFSQDRISSSTSDDGGKVSQGIALKSNEKELHSYSHYELKDIGFVVIEEHCETKHANLENKEHKDLKEKESSSSCNTSNSNSSSPYYDASGEMVESLGSDEVSSSMEVLHSSAEISDISQANWSSMTDQSTPSLDGQGHDEGSDKSVPLREIRKGPLTWSGQRDSRFSTISCCTDASEGELIFSETEGEELPYEDTTDDDLTLEEEAIKVLAEVRMEKAQGLSKNLRYSAWDTW